MFSGCYNIRMRCMGGVEQLDATLASLAREEGALRLRLGQLLEVLGRGAVFDLGFSSLGAYAVERCERSVRWAEAARCLARRAEALPELRRAVAMGKISWTMGEALARVAAPVDEARWLALAEGRTVRQVQLLVDGAVSSVRDSDTLRTKTRAVALELPVVDGGARDGSGPAGPVGSVGSASSDGTDGEDGHGLSGDPDQLCTLTCTVDREDAWLFEATRCLLDQLGERGVLAQTEALLAEAQGTLLALLPCGDIGEGCSHEGCSHEGCSHEGCSHEDVAAQRGWVEQLRRWRAEAEVMCEKNVLRALASAGAPSLEESVGQLAMAASLGIGSLNISSLEHMSCVVLDQQVRSVSHALARHELELSQVVLRFHRADGWRRLGYATEAQYARERLGISRSSLAARRALALRLERLPRVAAALGTSLIGVEAALQLVRIATPKTEAAWIERASRRTIKHLREEVAAALTAVRLAGELDCPPPSDGEMAAFQSLEQMVVSGRFAQPQRSDDSSGASSSALSAGAARALVEPTTEPRSAWCVMLGSLAAWLAGGVQMPAAPRVSSRVCSLAGRVTLRLRVTRDIFSLWRGLETRARRWLPRGVSWLRFLCLSLWHAWRHVLGTQVAYGHIYVRDRFHCTSPVCNRRDVTPHHIQFRSAGGSDEAHNITSPCTWCHLHGVHGGRIRASGTADHLRWELGPRHAPTLVVHGRERMVA